MRNVQSTALPTRLLAELLSNHLPLLIKRLFKNAACVGNSVAI